MHEPVRVLVLVLGCLSVVCLASSRREEVDPARGAARCPEEEAVRMTQAGQSGVPERESIVARRHQRVPRAGCSSSSHTYGLPPGGAALQAGLPSSVDLGL